MCSYNFLKNRTYGGDNAVFKGCQYVIFKRVFVTFADYIQTDYERIVTNYIAIA